MNKCNGKLYWYGRPCPRESLVDLALQGGAPAAPDGFARPADDGLGDVGPLVSVRLVPLDEPPVLLAQGTEFTVVVTSHSCSRSIPFKN